MGITEVGGATTGVGAEADTQAVTGMTIMTGDHPRPVITTEVNSYFSNPSIVFLQFYSGYDRYDDAYGPPRHRDDRYYDSRDRYYREPRDRYYEDRDRYRESERYSHREGERYYEGGAGPSSSYHGRGGPGEDRYGSGGGAGSSRSRGPPEYEPREPRHYDKYERDRHYERGYDRYLCTLFVKDVYFLGHHFKILQYGWR